MSLVGRGRSASYVSPQPRLVSELCLLLAAVVLRFISLLGRVWSKSCISCWPRLVIELCLLLAHLGSLVMSLLGPSRSMSYASLLGRALSASLIDSFNSPFLFLCRSLTYM